jgi:hypothetical protein
LYWLYEPVWAIAETASPNKLKKCKFIRETVLKALDKTQLKTFLSFMEEVLNLKMQKRNILKGRC